jgi:flagellar motor switch protein FliM
MAERDSKQALAPAPAHEENDDLGPTVSPAVARLPVELDVAVPVGEFRVRHLLALEPGQVIESQWSSGDDTPLAAGNVRLAWTEFEVVDTQMAVRVTRLA